MRARDSPRCLYNQRAQEDGSTDQSVKARRGDHSPPAPVGEEGTVHSWWPRVSTGAPRRATAVATAGGGHSGPWAAAVEVPAAPGGGAGGGREGVGRGCLPPAGVPTAPPPAATPPPLAAGRAAAAPTPSSRPHTKQPPPHPAAAPDTASRRAATRPPPRLPATCRRWCARRGRRAPARPPAYCPTVGSAKRGSFSRYFCSSRRRLLTVRTRTGPLACPTPAVTPHRKRRREEGQEGGGGSLLAVPRRPSDGRTLRRRRDVRPPWWSERAPPPTGTGDPLAAVAGSRRASVVRGCGRHYRSTPAQSSPHHPPLLMPPF